MSPKKHAHIYAVITPLQLLVVAAILDQSERDPDHTHIAFVFFTKPLEFEIPGCTLVYYDTAGYYHLFRAIMKFRDEINRIRSSFSKLSVYLPHPYHLPTNYLLFGIRNRCAYLIPDGLLNYYHRPIRFPQFAAMLAKSLLAPMLGIRYRPYLGHLTAFDQNVYQGVYTFNPQGLVTQTGRLHRISTRFLSVGTEDRGDPNSCLVLDQDIENILGGDIAKKMQSTLRNHIASMGYQSILYKRHPSQCEGSGWIKKSNLPVQIVDSPLPAELLVQKYAPAEVVSFFSSALLNVKDIYPHVKCTAVGTNAFMSYESKDLIALFIQRGIHIIGI